MSEIPGVLPFQASEGDDPQLAAQVAAMYAATPPADAGAADRCARAVLAAGMHAPSRGVLGVLRPRWWWGAAAAVLLVAVTTKPWRARAVVGLSDSASTGVIQPSGVVTQIEGTEAVRFELKLPATARAVNIVGDFNSWDEKATPMTRADGKDTWAVQVPLSPGRYVYAFVVDGTRWLVDPLAPQVADAGFGPSSAVIVEGGPQ